MATTRTNVYAPGGPWAAPILWYARAVAAMKAEALATPTSWRFYGAIHGFDSGMWTALGYLKPTDSLPSSAIQKNVWAQCQHGSWYFLPWHRGYLLAFEANIRAQVVKLGGPADWALPYWNYFNDGQNALPPEFASADWPDGHGVNPLFVAERYGPQGNGNVVVPKNSINLKAMSNHVFTGVANGGSKGFGGADTGFSHSAGTFGALESQPHNIVHTMVGGQLPDGSPGLMSDPDTAGLDPIFWLHHANIDRLWEVWNDNPATNVDPTDPNWLNGPASIGERAFVMPMPDGTTWTYTPAEMVNLTTLGYTYDDLTPQGQHITHAQRLNMLGFMMPAAALASGVSPVTPGTNVELVGASATGVPLATEPVHVPVAMDRTSRQKVGASLTPSDAAPAPDKVFLNLENLRGTSDANSYEVFVGLPEGKRPADHPELLAGSFSLFGIRKASNPDGEHGGQGLTITLDITETVDKLHLSKSFDVDSLHVWVVPAEGASTKTTTTIGRISIYRQGK
jgi:tyrosinase